MSVRKAKISKCHFEGFRFISSSLFSYIISFRKRTHLLNISWSCFNSDHFLYFRSSMYINSIMIQNWVRRNIKKKQKPPQQHQSRFTICRPPQHRREGEEEDSSCRQLTERLQRKMWRNLKVGERLEMKNKRHQRLQLNPNHYN